MLEAYRLLLPEWQSFSLSVAHFWILNQFLRVQFIFVAIFVGIREPCCHQSNHLLECEILGIWELSLRVCILSGILRGDCSSDVFPALSCIEEVIFQRELALNTDSAEEEDL